MASKCTTDKLVTCIDTTPNVDINLSTLITPETPTPDKNLDTATKGSWVWQYFNPIVVDGTPYKALEDFNICDKIFCITSDNALNNQTMGSHLANLIDFDNQNCLLGCMAHVINLAAQAGIKVFSKSPPPSTALPGGLMNILNDGPTAVKVKSIISQINGLASFMKHSSQKAKLFANITARKQGEELVEESGPALCFLGASPDATNTITPEDTVSLGLAALVYTLLIKTLNQAKMSYEAQELILAATAMLNKLTGYFKAAINKPVYLCSSILNP
ncbi:hypothetical protein MJO28_004390 [Puccinia striiformis f. sp. tritici]|uniref:Uncharacterized protein n=1 Tax=Puccinia striiformis f. sp. tritici TaxID=168172 RepID=A0ACC0EQC7_9BASI|nr:hypothetical protein MJO28_004390 [Puccinia striiformis f. sp. tritici]